MVTGMPWAHRPALEADLNGLKVEGVEGVEDDLHARPHQCGVDLEGVAVQGDGRCLGDRADLGPQERLVERILGRESWRTASQQPVDRCLTGLCVDAAVIDGLDPGGKEPVELGQVGWRFGLDFDEELHAHRLEDPFDLPPALRSSGLTVHKAHPEAGTRPQELARHHGGPVVQVNRTGHTTR